MEVSRGGRRGTPMCMCTTEAFLCVIHDSRDGGSLRLLAKVPKRVLNWTTRLSETQLVFSITVLSSRGTTSVKTTLPVIIHYY